MEYEQLSMIKQLNNTNCTYKSSNLILSSYELSITQQRIINLGCKKIQPIYIENKITPNDLEKVLGAMKFSKIEISTSEYKDEYSIKGNNIYDSLEEECNDLYENREIKYFGDNDKIGRKRWVSTLEYDRPNGKIDLTFNSDVILDLLVFKGKYVALFFDMSQNTKSKYAFRIYEILKSHAYLGSCRFLVEEFKFLLDITDKYAEFADLNKKVIKPNLKAVNEYGDITAECKPIRSGRSVKWIEFIIKNKSNKTFTPNNNFKNTIPKAFKEVSDALSKFDVELTSSDAEMLFDLAIEVTSKKYPDKDCVSYILEKIKVLDSYIMHKDVDNVIGFLKQAIINDYQKCPVKQKAVNGFNNFEGRQYNHGALEEMLVGDAEYDETKIYNEQYK